MNGMNRRDFLKTAAVGAVTLAGAGLLAGCNTPTQQSGNAQQWDMAADLVVVGGGTGQFGAIVGSLAGMKVILLEKRSGVGGAMALSGGNAWLANNKYSQAMGDSYEKAKKYLDHMQMGMGNNEIVEAYLNNTQKVIDLLDKVGVQLRPVPRGGEYQTTWEGAQNEGGRSCQVLGDNTSGKDISEAGGRRMNNAFMAACEKRGISVFTNTSGSRLITKRTDSDAVPEVIGIVAIDSKGNELRIKANKGVLLATGGFEWNEELVKNYLRVPVPVGAAISWPGNTGDAMRMVQSVGADLRLMSQTFGMPFFTVHAEYAKKHSQMATMAGNAARQNPGSIIVDANGRRFVREDAGYMSMVNAFGGYNNFHEEGYTANPAWWICDQASYDENKGPTGRIRSWGYPCPDIPEEEYVYKANTLQELGEKIGINAEEFVKTVEEYNTYAAQGKDPLFHRGEVPVMGQPAISLKPLLKPPFHAVAISAGAVGTIGGPRLNANAQVMNVTGVPIKGLYAMGNCAGVGGPGPSYGGEGGTIGPALVMGVIAAQHATARTDVTDKDFFVKEKSASDESASSNIQLADNEYLGTGTGIDGPVKVKLTVENGKMTKIEVVEQHETEGIGSKAVAQLPDAILKAQSTKVDGVAGASVSSKAILDAVADAMRQAGLK